MDLNSINNDTPMLKPAQDSQKAPEEQSACCSNEKFSDILASAENAQSNTNQTQLIEK